MADITQEILTGAGVIGLLIGAVGGLRSAQKDSVIKVLTQDNIATKEYNKTLEAEITKVTAERDSLQVQSDTFREHAQGSPQLKALTKAVENQTKVLSEYFSKDKKDGRRGRAKTK